MLKSLALLLATLCIGQVVGDYAFGTYYRLFNAQSYWNSRPVNPVFAVNVTVPTSYYYPDVSNGEWSTGVYQTGPSDPPQTIYGPNGTQINNVDNFAGIPNITLPHWPAHAIPASGGDGHCDIVDNTTNILHSFWQLRVNNVTGVWTAVQYAWAPLDGYGFGQPDHFYQGARAAGVPTSAGIIRTHEIDDGLPVYRHALAMSMTFNGLCPNPTYVFPATSADSGAQYSDTGLIPEGALVMLPSTYNTSVITSPVLLKIVNTLMIYGAYVVDRNTGTPFELYVENGAPFHLSNKSGWDPVIANELQDIRANLRMVASADHFLDGNGEVLLPQKNVNLLSMRGSSEAWNRAYGDAVAYFDTWSQSLIFSASTATSTTYQNWSGLGFNQVRWAVFQANTNYTFFVQSTGGVAVGINIQFNQTTQGEVFKSNLGDGESATFIWPEGKPYMVLYAYKPAGAGASGRGFIMETSNMDPPMTSQPKFNQHSTGKISINF